MAGRRTARACIFAVALHMCAPGASGFRLQSEAESFRQETEYLLRFIPEVVKGTKLDMFVPGASNLDSELEHFREATRDHIFERTLTNANETEARVALLQVTDEMVRSRKGLMTGGQDPGADADGDGDGDGDGDSDAKNGKKAITWQHGGNCDAGYIWQENALGLKTKLDTERFQLSEMNINVWAEYQGGKWSPWACSYGMRLNLNRMSICDDLITANITKWQVKGYKWTYARPGNTCPLDSVASKLDLPLRSHLTVYFTSSCSGSSPTPAMPWQVPWSSGIGADVRPQCLLAMMKRSWAKDGFYPEKLFMPFVPSGGYGVVWYGDMLEQDRGYTHVFRIIYRNPHFPLAYSWIVVWLSGWDSKPTSWSVTVGHRHAQPQYERNIDPRG